jgi:CheY-like chemotaxis protein
MAKILVIDDDAAIRRMLVRILTTAGHSVMEAPDGREGIELLHASQTKVVITDIIMPRQEGIETILEIRREAPAVRIIAMSGSSQNSGMSYLDFAAKLGAHAVLAKPFRASALLDAVAEVLSSKGDQ